MGLLDGKVAVITGAGSGMAKASVKIFVREGAKVVAADVSAVTKAAAVEYGRKGIRANCICPGNILTEIMGAAGEKHLPGFHERAALGRAGEPYEVAEVGAFLCSDRASFVSGAVIPVDGAWSVRVA